MGICRGSTGVRESTGMMENEIEKILQSDMEIGIRQMFIYGDWGWFIVSF